MIINIDQNLDNQIYVPISVHDQYGLKKRIKRINELYTVNGIVTIYRIKHNKLRNELTDITMAFLTSELYAVFPLRFMARN